MFENITHLDLQHYWWIIISLLGSVLVFLMFVQGGQTFIFNLANNDEEKTLIINALGRKWELTFTTLVIFGGAIFASFPLLYSTSFGGAYYLWFILLFCFIIQAIAYEFRSKPNNIWGSKTYETFLFINGLFGPFFFGVIIGTFFNGSCFSINEMNFSAWQNPYYGLDALFNFHNITLGIATMLLTRVLGLLYFMNNINNSNIFKKAKKHLLINSILFTIFFLTFIIWLFFKPGYEYNPTTKIVFLVTNKYLNNFIEMPLLAALFLAGILSVLFGIIISLIKNYKNGFWFSGLGAIAVVFGLFIITGFKNTAYYPSTYDLQCSLTIQNSSSSYYTLKILSIVSFLIPIVTAYIIYVWRAINKKQIDTKELKEENFHVY